MTREWREQDHPRHPEGAPRSQGGRFAAAGVYGVMGDTMGRSWVDRVSRRLAGGGYIPGQWERVTPDQYRQQLREELSRDMPVEVVDELFRDYDWPAVVLSNGDHQIVIHNELLAQGWGDAIIAQLDELQAQFPIPYPIRFAVVPERTIGGDRGMAIPGTGIFYLGESAFDDWPDDMALSFTMPAAGRDGDSPVEMWRYAITHEWGHLVDPHPGDKPPHGDSWVHTMSDYGLKRWEEATAEAFAEFYLSRGQTRNAAAEAYAVWADWEWR